MCPCLGRSHADGPGHAGNAPALSLDLHDQHVAMRKNGQWRFTPPTHVLAAFHAALLQYAAEALAEMGVDSAAPA